MSGPPVGAEWTVVRVVRVTDGDTLRVIRTRSIDLDGRRYRITDDEPDGVAIRLVWVNTPERGTGPGWAAARADLTKWLADVITAAAGDLRVICYESGGWDRIMGDLLDGAGASASQWLMTVRGWPPYTGPRA
jgi:hypothetical protein